MRDARAGGCARADPAGRSELRTLPPSPTPSEACDRVAVGLLFDWESGKIDELFRFPGLYSPHYMWLPVHFSPRRRAVMPGFMALILAGCSAVPKTDSAPPVGIRLVDAPEPQNLQEKPIDLTAQPGSNSGGMKALDAQGDIPQLLNQIHSEQEATKK